MNHERARSGVDINTELERILQIVLSAKRAGLSYPVDGQDSCCSASNKERLNKQFTVIGSAVGHQARKAQSKKASSRIAIKHGVVQGNTGTAAI